MRLGIMQPYFFPYLGYFSLIKHTDEFILLDTVQFIRHGWIERNRILKPSGDRWQYISVPLVKHEQKCLIKNIEINNSSDWKGKLLAQLIHYKKAPYYRAVIGLMQDILSHDYKDIVSINKKSLEVICDYLNIATSIKLFSDMNIVIDRAGSADEWALNICMAIKGVDEYWNPPGGQSFFDVNKYKNAGIDIKFQKITLRQYPQFRNEFEEGLSIIDAMMFNPPDVVSKMLDDFILL